MYNIVAADSRAARNGKFIEIIGRYEPLKNPMLITTNDQRVLYWLKCGALPTDTVKSLLQRSGFWLRWSLLKRGVDESKISVEMEKWQMAQAEKRQRDEARKARRMAARRKARATAESVPAATEPAAPAPAQS
jgi:small subunit ribosomal protein S16